MTLFIPKHTHTHLSCTDLTQRLRSLTQGVILYNPAKSDHFLLFFFQSILLQGLTLNFIGQVLFNFDDAQNIYLHFISNWLNHIKLLIFYHFSPSLQKWQLPI